jgi:hypothetical protein
MLKFHTTRLVTSLLLTVAALFCFVACGQAPIQSQRADVVAYTVNTGVVETPDEAAKPAKEATEEHLDPMAYQYEVYSGKAFEVIDRMTPRCTSCHRISTQGNARGAGPSLNGLKDRAGDRVPGLSARDYVKQSILDPSAHVVDECPTGECVDVMYGFYADKLEDGELDILVNYLLSLEGEENAASSSTE